MSCPELRIRVALASRVFYLNQIQLVPASSSEIRTSPTCPHDTKPPSTLHFGHFHRGILYPPKRFISKEGFSLYFEHQAEPPSSLYT